MGLEGVMGWFMGGRGGGDVRGYRKKQQGGVKEDIQQAAKYIAMLA